MTRWEHMLVTLIPKEPEPEGFKTCTLCHNNLPQSDFYKSEHKRTSRCKTCYRALVKQRTEKLNEARR
jgi:hypothetical protein